MKIAEITKSYQAVVHQQCIKLEQAEKLLQIFQNIGFHTYRLPFLDMSTEEYKVLYGP